MQLPAWLSSVELRACLLPSCPLGTWRDLATAGRQPARGEVPAWCLALQSRLPKGPAWPSRAAPSGSCSHAASGRPLSPLRPDLGAYLLIPRGDYRALRCREVKLDEAGASFQRDLLCTAGEAARHWRILLQPGLPCPAPVGRRGGASRPQAEEILLLNTNLINANSRRGCAQTFPCSIRLRVQWFGVLVSWGRMSLCVCWESGG